ncbi:MAG: DoxX family protein [Verrucomicrobiota bacterium]
MEFVCMGLQLLTGLTILNVWFLRYNKSTPYRGGEATTLKEEFKVYGLNDQMFYLVGFLKVSSAIGLLSGLIVPVLTLPSAILLGLLMLGAFFMHLKVSDPIVKAAPSITLLLFCITMALTCEKSFWVQMIG